TPCPLLAHRHGRRARPRAGRVARRRRIHRGPADPWPALPGADQQLDLHPPRPPCPSVPQRDGAARGVHLDQCTGDRALPGRAGARCRGLRDRRGRPDQRHARGGLILADADVEFVVLGETRTYSFSALTRAIRLIKGGAKCIATNPDVTGPSAEGPLPATGAVAAMITAATGISPYYIGKPNPLMMRTALNRIGAHSETSVMIGDRDRKSVG